MPDPRHPVLTGGCQCGAVRYALYAEPYNPHICHCRMCQKAFGSFFAPLANVKLADFAWTRSQPGIYKSSAAVERGFCAACGTPLTFRYVETDRIGFSIGSLDQPERVRPAKQFGIESRVAYFPELPSLPGERTEDIIPRDWMAKLSSLQHPDHESGT